MTRLLTVMDSFRLTPNMQRIALGGPNLGDFPRDQNSAYVKLAFKTPPKVFELKRQIRSLLHRDHPQLRSYTIRDFDADREAVLIDFVLHGEGGPAADWARKAKPGDAIVVRGPGPKKLVDMSAEWFFLAGDMSALPAIAANVEQLPRDARGHVIVEVIDDEDRQALDLPAGVEVQWIVNPHPERPNTVLLDAVRGVAWPGGNVGVWVAGELDAMRRIRQYLKDECGVTREQMYASSYWQMGRSDEQHRVEKGRDSG